jgi:hypothetical protein
MTTQEQAHIEGFIKRAAEYNVSETQALQIYKSGSITGNILKALASKIPGAAAVGNVARGVAEHARTVAPEVGDALATGAKRLAGTGLSAAGFAVPRLGEGLMRDVPAGTTAAKVLGQTYQKYKPQAGNVLGDTASNAFTAATEGLSPRMRQHLGIEYYGGMHDTVNPAVSSKADSAVRALQRMLRPTPRPVPAP